MRIGEYFEGTVTFMRTYRVTAQSLVPALGLWLASLSVRFSRPMNTAALHNHTYFYPLHTHTHIHTHTHHTHTHTHTHKPHTRAHTHTTYIHTPTHAPHTRTHTRTHSLGCNDFSLSTRSRNFGMTEFENLEDVKHSVSPGYEPPQYYKVSVQYCQFCF